mmetsp:Transcript_59744/g.142153  ORF Transcript_59744/g.142153 Transcript_59744/m.142153 type:complete len:205 (-) Transcript_59744:111-725(-)|eukprot:CAMPEP_0178426832 /NCGR_PEP_ID=MMETSP0689_2-20121128/29434_1 /TAXON_ID=160604 /ORGANISM="Amphidinium massartii, Strain CS-259" /LENGTH=204 /DNA_ID=CAMNT_0020048523 /DNA_START=189 /DNA_END=803 /DNA_ORIENTATION=-
MRTASFASSSVMQCWQSVWTDRHFITGVPTALNASAQLKSKSSMATQAVTSGCCLSHCPISRALRSHHAITGSGMSVFGFKMTVESLSLGSSLLLKITPIEFFMASVRRHSEAKTMVAPVCMIIDRRLPSAAALKSDSLIFSRTGNATPSIIMVWTLPVGRSTPSISRKITFDLSSGGSLGRAFLVAAARAAASLSGSGGGKKS